LAKNALFVHLSISRAEHALYVPGAALPKFHTMVAVVLLSHYPILIVRLPEQTEITGGEERDIRDFIRKNFDNIRPDVFS
jgi:hypothetical protein